MAPHDDAGWAVSALGWSARCGNGGPGWSSGRLWRCADQGTAGASWPRVGELAQPAMPDLWGGQRAEGQTAVRPVRHCERLVD
eukprot:7097075-Lingulodinium_polyedra.AAC.1